MYIGMHYWARKEGVCLSRDNAFRALYRKRHIFDGVGLNTLGSILFLGGLTLTVLATAFGLVVLWLPSISVSYETVDWIGSICLVTLFLGVTLLMPGAIFINSINRVARWFDLRSYTFLRMSRSELTTAANQRLRQLAQYLAEVERMVKPFNYNRAIAEAEENFQRAYRDFVNAGLIKDVGLKKFRLSPY